MLGIEEISDAPRFANALLGEETDRLAVPLSAAKEKERGGILARIGDSVVELPIPVSYAKGRKKDFTLYWLAVERMKKLLLNHESNLRTK